MPTIDDIKNAVTSVADIYEIKNVRLFGSYAHGTQTPESDIDLIVRFRKPFVSLLQLVRLQNELIDKTGKRVEIIGAPIPKESLLIIDREVVIYDNKRAG